ncbi:MAG: orotate phosphoribosyltransferase [Promethearchaeota archaeon]|nr:MAG: orotate phosphoribosyltransferase [Candidatus Lokiarchaeota archaeon]
MVLSEWKKELVKYVVHRRGLLFGEFKLKSGRISPYFFNLAYLINDGDGLQKTAQAFTKSINENITLQNFDYIQGPAYKAIPLAGAIAMTIHRDYGINKRWGYDRKESKEHGVSTEAWLVGDIRDRDRIILVDDVITTGLTKINNIAKVKEYSRKSNLTFEALFIFLDRQEQDQDGKDPVSFLEQEGLRVYSILQIKEVVEFLRDGLITSGQYESFQKYFQEFGTG